MQKFNIENMRTDMELEREGVWVVCENGLELLIARAGNTAYLAHVRTLSLEKGVDSDGELDSAMLEDILMEGLSTNVLKGWRGMHRPFLDSDVPDQDDAENPFVAPADGLIVVDYSPEIAREYLTSIPDLYRLVMRLSNDTKRFRKAKIEAQAKK